MSTGMDEREIAETDVDELWLREWAQAGLADLEAYLRARPDLESADDGSARSV